MTTLPVKSNREAKGLSDAVRPRIPIPQELDQQRQWKQPVWNGVPQGRKLPCLLVKANLDHPTLLSSFNVRLSEWSAEQGVSEHVAVCFFVG